MTQEFNIEKNINIPGKGYKYPFSDMRINDSFYITGLGAFKRARTSASQFGARHKIKFATRVSQDRKGGRIWRIK